MDRPGVEVLSFRNAGSSKVSSKKLSERAHLLSIKSNISIEPWRGRILAAKESAMGQQDGMRLNLTLSRPTAVVKSWGRESALSPSQSRRSKRILYSDHSFVPLSGHTLSSPRRSAPSNPMKNTPIPQDSTPHDELVGVDRRIPWGLTLGGVLVALGTYAVLFGDGHTIFAFAGKEQLFEHLSAWLFLLACLFSLAALDHARRRGAPWLRRLAFGFLALFFFLAFGEELSWGQHFLGYETPESLRGINQQGEFNLHNLSIIDSRTDSGERSLMRLLFNSNRLFDYFMIGLFLILPVGHRFMPWVRQLHQRLSAPRMALALGIPLILNWLLTIASEFWLVDNEFRHMAVSEIRELNYALLCTSGLFFLFLVEKRLRQVGEPRES